MFDGYSMKIIRKINKKLSMIEIGPAKRTLVRLFHPLFYATTVIDMFTRKLNYKLILFEFL